MEIAPTSDAIPRPLVTQLTGPEQALPPGTNLQYFEDDEPEEMELDRSRDQRMAEQIEQKPPDQEVTITSPESVGQGAENNDRNVAEQRETATLTNVQMSRYPKWERRPPDFYGGFHYW